MTPACTGTHPNQAARCPGALLLRIDETGMGTTPGSAWILVCFVPKDVIPRASSRTLKGATSEILVCHFQLPPTWSVVTQYFDDGGQIQIEVPGRRFDQPSGWIVLGDLGVRRERIASMRVAVAGPVDHAVRTSRHHRPAELDVARTCPPVAGAAFQANDCQCWRANVAWWVIGTTIAVPACRTSADQ